MKLRDLIADYVTFRQSMGQKFTSCNDRLQAFCRAVGRESLITEQWAPLQRQDEMIAEIQSILSTRPLEEWLRIFDPEKICVAPVNTFEEALEDPHIRHRETWFSGELPDGGGKVPQAALPVSFGEGRPGWRFHPPQLGEHTGEILRQMGLADVEIDELRSLEVI